MGRHVLRPWRDVFFPLAEFPRTRCVRSVTTSSAVPSAVPSAVLGIWGLPEARSSASAVRAVMTDTLGRAVWLLAEADE